MDSAMRSFEKLKIVIPVDPENPVPPPLYGGVERLVDGLITEYSKRGHEVILLAHPGSTARDVSARYSWPVGTSRGKLNIPRNAWKLFQVCRKERPHVIHSFCRLMYLYPSMLFLGIPAVMTYGRRISTKSTALASILGGKRIRFTSAASHMLNHLGRFRHKFSTVYNFVPVHFFRPDPDAKREHLMFLGRIENIKGTKECIDVAKASGKKLVIAGNIQPGHEDYFKKYIEPELDNPSVHYTGPVDDEKKRYYLQRAQALLFPIKWEEPFGIVIAEAMACGVPVIGFRRGSVPELIKDGINGFAVTGTEEMTAAVGKLASIDPDAVREDCVKRFSREVVATEYLRVMDEHLRRNQ